MGWITPIAFLLCHTYSIGDAATLETFSSKSVLSPERGALTGHFRKYLETACPTQFANPWTASEVGQTVSSAGPPGSHFLQLLSSARGYLDRQWIGFHHTFVGRS